MHEVYVLTNHAGGLYRPIDILHSLSKLLCIYIVYIKILYHFIIIILYCTYLYYNFILYTITIIMNISI